MSTTPFSYYLYHTPTEQHYYGIKYAKNCNPQMLWSTYFSSSAKVAALIQEYSVDSFIFEIRKIFKTGEDALKWEHKVLRRLNAAHREDWLNRHNGSNKFRPPLAHSEKTKETIRRKITGKKRSAFTKEKQSIAAINREIVRRQTNWKMSDEAKTRIVATRQTRIATGEINPYSTERNEKMSQSKTGAKRQYLPDGSFIMVKIQRDQ